MSKNKYPSSPSLRGPNSPRVQSRQASIVEMLSLPPPLEGQQQLSSPHSQGQAASARSSTSSSHRSISSELEGSAASAASAFTSAPAQVAAAGAAGGDGSAPTFHSPFGSVSGAGQQSPHSPQFQQSQQSQQSQGSLGAVLNSAGGNAGATTTCDQGLYGGLSRNPSIASSILSGSASDWQNTPLSELVESAKLIFIKDTLSVEEAFKTLVNHGLTSVPVEHYDNDPNCLTFDYADLNAYLMLVLNKIKAENLSTMSYEPRDQIPELIRRAQRGEQVPVSFVIRMTTKNPFIKLSESDNLSTVVEILGTGVHRVAITKDNTLTGVLSQRRLVKWLWDNARRFPSMEPVFTSSLQRLQIGSSNPVSVFGDQLLIEAFMKMYSLKISSLAVVDRNYRLLGNISVTDVRLVSKSSRSDLLYKTALHFISVILNSRGLENGKDSFPIFHVTTASSLARTIAKLVATKSHRLWIVKPDNPQPPATISQQPLSPAATGSSFDRHGSIGASPMHQSGSSFSAEMASATQAAVTQEREISNGKLVGVISLTDILSLFARTLGKDHVDPSIARKQRRRSSSSSSSMTSGSLEQFRKSISESSGRP